MFNWQQIDTVLLDMDGTLLDLSYDNYFWLEYLPLEYAKQAGLPLEEARAELEILSASLHGSLNWYCVDYWSDYLKLNIEAMKHEIRHLIRLRPNTLEFLAHLQALGKDAILVTNAHPKALELKVASSGLQQHLKKIISSHEFSLAKENAGFWHKLRDREALDLSRCLFIDDSLNVLNCARNEGVRHTIQILHPDTTQPPRPVSDFPGIHDFDELMIHEQKKYQA